MAASPVPALANERKVKWTAKVRVQILFQVHVERALFDVAPGAAIIKIQKRLKLAIDIPIEFRPIACMTIIRSEVEQDHDIQIIRYKWTHS